MPPIAPDTAPDVNWTSHSSCTTYTDQRRSQLQTDVSELELLRDELLRSQKEAINKGLCKLNKDVKTLSIKEFNGMFGCDIVDMIRKQMEAGGVGSSSANGAKKRFRSNAGVASAVVQPAAGANGLSFKTPAVSRLGGGKPPMTTTRTARKGEVVKS